MMITQNAMVWSLLPMLTFAAGALVVWAFMNRASSQALRALDTQLTSSAADARTFQSLLAQEQGKNAMLVGERDAAKVDMRAAFEGLAADALKSASAHLLTTANETLAKERALTLEGVKTVVSPLNEEIAKVKSGIVEASASDAATN